MRRSVIIGGAVVVIGGLALVTGLLFLKGLPGGPKCPLTFPEFAVAPKEGVVNVTGRAVYPDGVPFARGPVDVNLTFMMPGCGVLPFSVMTDGNGRFNADSPPKERTCIGQGGTATARTKAGCEIEGTTQGAW